MTPLEVRAQGLSRRPSLKGLRSVGLVFNLILAGCAVQSAPDSIAQARQRVLRNVPTGWRLAKDRVDQVPFEHRPIPGFARGEELILEGPTAVKVSGYYCGGAYCEDRPAKEAIALWIMPAAYAGDTFPSLMSLRSPVEIYIGGQVRVFAMATRLLDGEPYDAAVTDASRETSSLKPSRDDPAPTSWCSWQQQIAAELADVARERRGVAGMSCH